MPPALRRSVSSPSVRVAPYTTSSSATTPSSSSAAAPVPGRPRRGASDASSRRVLADIEWWRVVQGQQSDECESENAPADDARQPEQRNGGADAVRPHTPEPISPLYTVSEDVHTGVDAVLPESPPSSPPPSAQSTPPRARPRAHHSLSFPGLTFAALYIDDTEPH